MSGAVVAPAPVRQDATLAARMRRRRAFVAAMRLLVLLVIVGGWEGSVRAGWLDPFFFGQPTEIAKRLYTWTVEGTSIGPLWEQIWVRCTRPG